MAAPDKRSRPFSLALYLLVVFALSWPFQVAFIFLGEAFRPILLLSMVMAGVGTFIAGKYVFKDGFKRAGWRWGKPRHYVLVFGLALFLWLVPVVLEHALGMRQGFDDLVSWSTVATFLATLFLTLIPAFGEEFSWRGYLLPRLLERHRPRQALLLHGFVTWLWHAPFIVTMGLGAGGSPLVSVPLVLAVSLIPTVMHAVVFAYIWSSASSLAVATVYHSAFDEVRDTLEQAVGFGWVSQYWQAVVLTIMGAVLLWKAEWRNLPRVETSPLGDSTNSRDSS